MITEGGEGQRNTEFITADTIRDKTKRFFDEAKNFSAIEIKGNWAYLHGKTVAYFDETGTKGLDDYSCRCSLYGRHGDREIELRLEQDGNKAPEIRIDTDQRTSYLGHHSNKLEDLDKYEVQRLVSVFGFDKSTVQQTPTVLPAPSVKG